MVYTPFFYHNACFVISSFLFFLVSCDRGGGIIHVVMRKAVADAMELIRKEEIQCAVLQSRSPTCGVNQVYDGSFSGKLIEGSGVLAQALKAAGYQVLDAEDVGKYI